MTKILHLALRLGQIVLVLFLGFFAIRIINYHITLVTFPFPVSFREGAMMTTTDALVKGLNPYDMSLQPQLMNPYGIIYPLLAWPWAKFFGTTMLMHRMITASSIAAICVLVFFILKRMRIAVLLNIWAVLMLYASLLFPSTSTPTIDPGATAIFFMLLTVFIPWFFEYSTKSLLVSILFGILAFYTKPYAVIGSVVIASYLFIFVSKRKALFYAGLGLALLAASVLLVDQLFPAYFDNCFFASFNMAREWSSMARLILQVHMYSGLYLWTLILMGVFILGYGLVVFQKYGLVPKGPISWLAALGAQLSTQSNLLKEISSNNAIRLVLWAGLWSAFVLYTTLGRHSGATLWYFFQLLSPYLLIAAARLFNSFSFWPLCIPLLILNLHTITADENHEWFNKSRPGWSDISLLLDHYTHVLGSPVIAPLLVQQNKEIFDNGETEYFLPGGRRNGWVANFLQEDKRVYIQEMLFFNNIRGRIQNKEFDLLLLQPNLLPLGIGDDIRRNYKFEGQIIVYPAQDRKPYGLTVWRPL